MNTLAPDALDRFEPHEFGQYWRFMSPALLLALDTFAKGWGPAVNMSPAPGAIGRWAGESGSGHNIEKWGEVLAVDVMPRGFTASPAENEKAYACAKRAGFIGFGVYPQWIPSPGLHLDVMPRANKRAGAVMATWRGERKPGLMPNGQRWPQQYLALEDIMPEGWQP